MKTINEILQAIEFIENTYTPETMPEYVRGQYNAFKWVIENSQEATEC